MAVDLRYVLDTLFAGLGLGPVPQTLTDAEDFDIDDARCVVARSPSGTEVTLRLDVGTLTRDPPVAAERLRQLHRLTLGLAVVNRAALVLAERPDDSALRALQAGTAAAPALRLQAVAQIGTASRQAVFRALEDVLQLRNLALPYLTPALRDGGDGLDLFPQRGPDRATPSRNGDGDDAPFLIFQP